ncbi:ankyrin repeat-containing domain protein [Phyllosticta citrichinensis]|uniref:Ankyrin repeat-containing domain protein n=1 Tax=Phyllosticta citrichinensis TaxID=1130410 RepID=A0ABR1Y8L0_9PEZI
MAKVKHTDKQVSLILARLGTIRVTIPQLQSWLHSDQNISPQVVTDLRTAIESCEIVVREVESHVLRVKSGWLGGKIRFIWDEGQFLMHQQSLDSQTAALGILLNVILLKSQTQQRVLLESLENRTTLRKAQDQASIYTPSIRQSTTVFGESADELSPLDSPRFGFDNDFQRSPQNSTRHARTTSSDARASTAGLSLASSSSANSSGSSIKSDGKRSIWKLSRRRSTFPKEICDAAQRGDSAEVIRLAGSGADVNSRYRKDSSPSIKSWTALPKRRFESLRRPEVTPLHLAVEANHLDVVRTLVSLGSNVNAKADAGKTPLHCCVSNECVEMLISLAADNQHRPLHLAVKNSHSGVVEALIEAEADVEAETAQGERPLHLALEKLNVAVVEALIKHGADVNVSTRTKESLILKACQTANSIDDALALIRALAEHGADINAVSASGQTPLSVACSRQDLALDLVRFLLQNGARVRHTDYPALWRNDKLPSWEKRAIHTALNEYAAEGLRGEELSWLIMSL